MRDDSHGRGGRPRGPRREFRRERRPREGSPPPRGEWRPHPPRREDREQPPRDDSRKFRAREHPRPRRDRQRSPRETHQFTRERAHPRERQRFEHSGPHPQDDRKYPPERLPERGRHGDEPRAHERDVVFGVEPVRELLRAAPMSIRALFVRKGDEPRFAKEVDLARSAGIAFQAADDPALERRAGVGTRHQGIVAEVRPYRYAQFDQVIADAPDPLLVIDGVTDPRNLGALMRSAEGAGVSAIALARDRTAAVTPAAIKSSAGAWIHLTIAHVGNVARGLEQLKQSGYWIAALAPGGPVSLYELDVTRKIALVVGSEDKGVRDIVKKTADFMVDIPMRGRVASLNVSVAAAVALYEIARRRDSGKPA